MTRIPTCTVLALAVASVSTVAFGQVLHVGAPGTFGTPYATMGTAGANTWELYRKQGSWVGGAPTVQGSNVAGNNTLALLTGQAGGDPGWATGQALLANTNATTPSTGLLYLKDMTSQAGVGANGYDANGRNPFDLRVGFVQSGTAYVTAKGGDNSDVDLFGGARGTNGVYMHLTTGSAGATTAGGLGNPWTASPNKGFYAFGATSGNEQAITPVLPAQTLINSGTAPVDAGTPYAGPLEVSSKMFADTAVPGNVVFQVKLGNNVFTNSFNPNDTAVFGPSGFDWANAKPIVFTGKNNWDAINNDVQARMGVLFKGDANADGKVNLTDFNAIRSNYNGTDKAWAQGDFSQDGKVNLTDFNTLRTSYNQTASGPLSIAAAATVQNAPAAGMIELVVDTNTGLIQLVGGTGASVSSYQIDSASGALDHTQWTSLGLSALSNSDTSIAEGALTTGPVLNGTSLSLGNIFRAGGAHDLVFTAFNNAGDEVTGNVVYAVPEPASLGLLAVASLGLIARRRKVA